MQVWLADDVPCSTGTWLAQRDGLTPGCPGEDKYAGSPGLEQTMMAALTAASDDGSSPADPAMVVYRMTPSGAPVLAGYLWQRWLSQHTALNSLPGWAVSPILISGCHAAEFYSTVVRHWARRDAASEAELYAAGILCLRSPFAAVLALCASAWNKPPAAAAGGV